LELINSVPGYLLPGGGAFNMLIFDTVHKQGESSEVTEACAALVNECKVHKKPIRKRWE
jgi:glycerate-2-kinase